MTKKTGFKELNSYKQQFVIDVDDDVFSLVTPPVQHTFPSLPNTLKKYIVFGLPIKMHIMVLPVFGYFRYLNRFKIHLEKIVGKDILKNIFRWRQKFAINCFSYGGKWSMWIPSYHWTNYCIDFSAYFNQITLLQVPSIVAFFTSFSSPYLSATQHLH